MNTCIPPEIDYLEMVYTVCVNTEAKFQFIFLKIILNNKHL